MWISAILVNRFCFIPAEKNFWKVHVSHVVVIYPSAFINLQLNLWYISALKIQCSTPMYDELKKNMAHAFVLQKRGEIDVKGKGRQVTYWLLRKDGGTPRQRRLQHSARSVNLSCRHFVIAVVLAFILPRLLKDCVPAGVHNNKLQAR